MRTILKEVINMMEIMGCIACIAVVIYFFVNIYFIATDIIFRNIDEIDIEEEMFEEE